MKSNTDNAPELVQRAGVTVRAYAEVEQKFTDLLLAQGAPVTSTGTVTEKAAVARKDSNGSENGENGGGNENGNGGNGGTTPPENGGENEE